MNSRCGAGISIWISFHHNFVLPFKIPGLKSTLRAGISIWISFFSSFHPHLEDFRTQRAQLGQSYFYPVLSLLFNFYKFTKSGTIPKVIFSEQEINILTIFMKGHEYERVWINAINNIIGNNIYYDCCYMLFFIFYLM